MAKEPTLVTRVKLLEQRVRQLERLAHPQGIILDDELAAAMQKFGTALLQVTCKGGGGGC
jgi:hypothetical protein